MELEQLILLMIDGDGAARPIVYLEGVAVIEDAQGGAVVVEVDVHRLRVNRGADVDGRLAGAEFAGCELIGQVAPQWLGPSSPV